MGTHIRTVHQGIKEFECHVCEKKFGYTGSLSTHIRTVHQGIKEYECHVCKKRFGRVGVLNKHIRTMHQGIKEPIEKMTLEEGANALPLSTEGGTPDLPIYVFNLVEVKEEEVDVKI